ncbi:MAG: hypothetical protein PHY92_00280 [Alphaproteobacteria bacterium]|nr:hypothetical protein [Alphaproteobacteria bacterium]
MKNVLLSTVAAGALVLMAAGAAQAANIEANGTSSNTVAASQAYSSSIQGSNVTETTSNTADYDDAVWETGDVIYGGTTTVAPGLFTLQNQTGLNNAGNNGANAAAQINEFVAPGPTNVHLKDSAANSVAANQVMGAQIDDSAVVVTPYATDEIAATPFRTGDVTYGGNTFGGMGVYTLQNNTGLNNASNNALNAAVQWNNDPADSVKLTDAATNTVVAAQALTSVISGSPVTINGAIDADTGLPSHTGDVNYAATTFGAPGVFTISNNTGLNNAANNGFNAAVQLNGL